MAHGRKSTVVMKLIDVAAVSPIDAPAWKNEMMLLICLRRNSGSRKDMSVAQRILNLHLYPVVQAVTSETSDADPITPINPVAAVGRL